MVNTFPIVKIEAFGGAIYFHANVRNADVVAGDKILVESDVLQWNGEYQIATISRNIDIARIVPVMTYEKEVFTRDNNFPERLLGGTITVIEKAKNRPEFPRYYDQYITPIYSSIYSKVVNNGGKAAFITPFGVALLPNRSVNILSRNGLYSGIHQPVKIEPHDGGTVVFERWNTLKFDFAFVGDDYGTIVYVETPAQAPVNYSKPYVDTTQPVPTVFNPTNTAIVVESKTNDGKTFSQVVDAGKSVVLAAPVEAAPAPVFTIEENAPVNLKSAPITQKKNQMTETEIKALVNAQMEIIKSDSEFITLIRNNYKNGSMGYTQTIASNAIKELKEAGIIPIDTFGVGIWGQSDWVRANYPKDDYTGEIKIVPDVNPNPGIITPLPAATITEVGQQVKKTVTAAKTEVNKATEGLNPMLKLALIGLGILLIIKLFK